MATLGISTNTRLLGLAIINQDRLVDYKINLHKSAWSPSKANLIVASVEPCVRQYCITRVVLSIPHAHHQTKAFKILISRIKAAFAAKKIPIYTEPVQAIYSLCPTGQKKTKKTLMHALTLQFPVLTYCYHKEIRNRNRYYIKVFEAVGVAALQERKE